MFNSDAGFTDDSILRSEFSRAINLQVFKVLEIDHYFLSDLQFSNPVKFVAIVDV